MLTETEAIEQELCDDGVCLCKSSDLDRPWKKELDGMCCVEGDCAVIAINDALSGTDRLVALAHETGHYHKGVTGVYCHPSSVEVLKAKDENRADWEVIERLDILPQVRQCIRQGCEDAYQISEELGYKVKHIERWMHLIEARYGERWWRKRLVG